MWDEAFSLFCKGLASNSSLTHLDLRNNQINHHGAAELALALKCNKNMQVLGDSPLNSIKCGGFFLQMRNLFDPNLIP